MKYRIVGFIIILGLLGQLFWVKNIFFGLPLTIAYLGLFSHLLGRRIFGKLEQPYQLSLGALTLCAIYSILGSAAFYTYQITAPIIASILTVVSIIIIWQAKHPEIKFHKINITKDDILIYLHCIYYGVLAILSYLLFKNSSSDVIKSVWVQLPPKFLILYSIALITLIALNFRNKSKWQYFNIGLFFFLTLNIANAIYSLGFGFDGFIHKATLQLLNDTGTISPKPPYYIGFYTLALFLNKLSGIKIGLINVLMTSVTALLLIPPLIGYGIKKFFKLGEGKVFNCLLLLLIIPCTLLVQSTPLALGLILSIIGSFLTLAYLQDRSTSLPFLILILTFVTTIHIFAAIPLAIIIGFAILKNIKEKRLRLLLEALWLIISSAIYPLAFLAANSVSINKVKIAWQGFDWHIFQLFPYVKQYNFFVDLAYFIGNLILPVIILSSLISIIISLKKKKWLGLPPVWLTFTALIINVFVLKCFIGFESLASYETNDFVVRLIQILPYFCLPLLIGIHEFANKTSHKSRYSKLSLLVILPTIIISSVYLSFPRWDDYQNSNFINVSRADYEAVKLVNDDSRVPYLVLSNQATSAAALDTFGFDHNIKLSDGHEIYFYPIPTSGMLYDYYLKMLETKTPAQLADEIKKQTGVTNVYLILSKSWRGWENIYSRIKTDNHMQEKDLQEKEGFIVVRF